MRRWIAGAAAAALGVSLTFVSTPAVQAYQTPQDGLVGEVAANFTPHVLDGQVNAIAQVGNMIVLGGEFTRVRSATSTTELPRTNLVAFNATTGAISSTFQPNPTGEVTAVIPAADGTSVYVGGSFNAIAGAATPSLARIRVSDGAPVAGFTVPAISGRVKDLRLVGNRLWLAGTFTHVGGKRQPALATVNATSGAFDPYMSLALAGVHNGGNTTIVKMDVNPQGTRLVGIGNVDTLQGVQNHQIFMLDLSGSTAQPADWQTNFYTSSCSSAFTSYMRDLDFSPDGSYFVVSTTGAYGGSSGGCDVTARFETGATGTALMPTWTDYTGGDTTYAVAVTGTAVYTGGHARWQNNPFAGDTPGPGAVSRPGIAALDPKNGLPFSWNPTRTRGVGVFDLLATSTGLWVGSDTDRIGAYQYKARIAYLPLSSGWSVPQTPAPSLGGSIYSAGSLSAATDPSYLYRINTGGPALPSTDAGPDWAADTAASSPLRVGGPNAASYSPSVARGPAVPATTPLAIFDTERWDDSAAPEMQWNLPVASGTPVKLRLYFANRYSGTSGVGQRVFDVQLEGSTVLDDYDIVRDVGDSTGTMKEFSLTSDGTISVRLTHGVENPLINGIEVIRTDLPPFVSGADKLSRTPYDGTTVGATTDVPTGGIAFSGVRGVFMSLGQAYIAGADGSFTRRTFDGSAWGTPTAVDTSDELVNLAAWHDEVTRMTGLFFDGPSGRMFFTLAGQNALYSRGFTTESDVVAAARVTVASNVPGINLAQVRGMFLANGKLYFGTAAGDLVRTDWSGSAPVAGTATTVSGPAIDGHRWDARALFVYQSADGTSPNIAPTASFTATCEDQECSFDASASADVDGTIQSYAWDFGDGDTGTGKTPTHVYGESGSFPVKLTVTDDRGGSAQSTQSLSVTYAYADPVAAFDVTCTPTRVCAFDAGASSDADGPLASYAWSFGDGDTGTGKTVSHTYDEDGDFTAVLTVTDGQGVTDQAQQVVHVEMPVVQVAYVGSSQANVNAARLATTVPAAVQAGDRLVVFLTWNTPSASPTRPGGWSVVGTTSSAQLATAVWTRTATAADAGAEVAVPMSAITKGSLVVVAYRGAAAVTAADLALALEDTIQATHTTPTVTVPQNGFVVSYWADKSSATTGWTLPAEVTLRGQSVGSGSGRAVAAYGDSGPLAAGQAGGWTATADSANAKAVMASVVLRPAP